LTKPEIMTMKKFRRIRFRDSKNWVLLHPQNKTLLFASDISGYWCREHRKEMSRSRQSYHITSITIMIEKYLIL
jgi:hypothetical protein